jgi:hypothetical protein
MELDNYKTVDYVDARRSAGKLGAEGGRFETMELAKNIDRIKPSGQIPALATSFLGTASTAFTAATIAPSLDDVLSGNQGVAVPLRQRFASAWAVVMRWLELPVLFLGLVVLFVIFPFDDKRGRQ